MFKTFKTIFSVFFQVRQKILNQNNNFSEYKKTNLVSGTPGSGPLLALGGGGLLGLGSSLGRGLGGGLLALGSLLGRGLLALGAGLLGLGSLLSRGLLALGSLLGRRLGLKIKKASFSKVYMGRITPTGFGY